MSATKAPKRLTRAESQERTRVLIVEAATRLFLRDGFKVTSLEAIAEEAGFTRGAVYSNFASKTEMGIAVIDGLYDRQEELLVQAIEALEDDEALFDVLTTWAEATIGDPNWMRLEIEIAASSAHDGSHRSATAARYARQRSRCAELLENRYGISPGDAQTLATSIIALALGVGVQRAADPSVPATAWTETLRTLLAGANH